ncbi:uncharacterized protein LOC130361894 [Hyla sarda]|uniref:uncharacterized protein LOC130361894 n=1 Tax=Hyla sarda TaxID=327740 RepID=UPI0024C2ECDF|nr:uncharacterized protein LOC130361894 [Hyla sarda]
MHHLPSTREEQNVNRVNNASSQSQSNQNNVYDDIEISDNSEFSDIEDSSYDPNFIEEDDSNYNDHISEDSNTVESNVLDSFGVPFFNPAQIIHPRSGDWTPNPQIDKFIALWLKKALDNKTRNKLRAECPRPSISEASTSTPELDPILVKYLQKSGKNPKKGIDRSFKLCQDRLMDLLGPIAKLLDLTENAAVAGTPLDIPTMRGCTQRLMCIFGNVNQSFCTERRRAILTKLDPQLAYLASNESSNPKDNFLFGDQFIKEISKYVGLFSSLDKAQTSLKKVFSSKVFTRAGRSRSRFSGRAQFRGQQRGSFQQDRNYPMPTAQPNPFFPYRGRPWRTRGQRGVTRSRPSAY